MPRSETNLPDIPNAALLSLEELSREFQNFVEGVDAELENEELSKDLPAEVVRDIEDMVGADSEASTLARRDRLAELIFAIDAQESRVRDHVKRAEMAARHLHALSERMKWSLLTYMLMRGIKMIPGEVSRFAVQKNPDRLIVTNEEEIPEEFFDVKTVTVRELNRDLLADALLSGREIPGAYVEKNRKRLSIK